MWSTFPYFHLLSAADIETKKKRLLFSLAVNYQEEARQMDFFVCERLSKIEVVKTREEGMCSKPWARDV